MRVGWDSGSLLAMEGRQVEGLLVLAILYAALGLLLAGHPDGPKLPSPK